MKKEINIPGNLKQQLTTDFSMEEPIVSCVQTDRNMSCELAHGYIILTRKRIFCAVAPSDTQQLYIYKEYPVRHRSFIHRLIHPDTKLTNYLKKSRRQILEPVTYQIVSYNIQEIDSLHIASQISGSILYTGGKDSIQLALFSNSYYQDMEQLIASFHELKNPDAIPGHQKAPGQLHDKNKAHKQVAGPMHDKEPNQPLSGPNSKNQKKNQTILRILIYFKPYIPQILLMILCYLAISALNLVWPYLNGTILYDKILQKNTGFLDQMGIPNFVIGLAMIVITMVATKLLLQILQIIQGMISATIVPKVISHMKASIFESMGKLSLSFFTSRETGNLMTRVLSDADRVTSFFVDILPYLLTNVLTIVSTCVIMFLLNAKLAIASLFLIPFLALISLKLLPQLFHLFGIRHRAERNMIAQINDNITGARVVKAFGQENHEIERFDKYNADVGNSELLLVGFDNRFTALYTFVKSAISLIVWGIGAYLVLSSEHMQMGMLITFAGYVEQLNGPLDLISRAIRSWTDSLNSAQRMFEIIDARPEITELEDTSTFSIQEGSITIENVTFGYEARRPVLHQINLSVEGGHMLGIVGRSGAGKSTLVNLISRLYDPQQGRILIDGVDIRTMAFTDLRKNIAMVSQETYIFMGTVAENISYACPDADRETIIRAAKLASAHDFICKLPNGYDTMIGSSGKSLSGGERQRLSIARAILADPKILILDEATASVDTETEKQIQKSLDYLTKNRTTISIAHRLSTLRNADRLIVIDHGFITESGTHQELVDLKGTYYKLMELQTKALAMKGID